MRWQLLLCEHRPAIYTIAPAVNRFFAGFFFVIGRIQLATLFIAERELVDQSAGTKIKAEDSENMGQSREILIEPMREDELDEAVELVSTAMNADEGQWARKTMEFYFACKKHGIDSGREYYLWRDGGEICGLVGLHRYIWGPEENVWLSWFAVHPGRQGGGAGSALIAAIKERAIRHGYKKLLVETYDGETFEKARSFYSSKGFSRIGRIENYLPDGSPMVVFGMEIAK
ncbi:MAG: GNAT family N-acetyltransferase [Planctomycetota bacterium]